MHGKTSAGRFSYVLMKQSAVFADYISYHT